MEEQKYLTVTALTKYIKTILEDNKYLKSIYIKGEISNLTKHSKGHFYFTLKDESAQIRCTMFASYTRNINFDLKDGDKVKLFGTMSVYEAGGSYSINAFSLDKDGIGALYLAYEKLKKELFEKGYFDDSKKKPIPKYPKAIGVVTSPTGAAIKDIIHTIQRRYPLAKLILYPALVQGEEAKYSIQNQILLANNQNLTDILIVGRGGGSLEDLWAFNEMPVIEAISQSKIPVISAVGHEIDFTLSDYVADLRAPTPTAAGELATPDQKELKAIIDTYTYQLQKEMENLVQGLETKWMHLDERLHLAEPTQLLKTYKDRLDQDIKALQFHYGRLIEQKKSKYFEYSSILKSFKITQLIQLKKMGLDQQTKKLDQSIKDIWNQNNNYFQSLLQQLTLQNPLTLMDKGYSYTTKNQHRLDSVESVSIGDTIETTLKDGVITSQVTKKEENTWKK